MGSLLGYHKLISKSFAHITPNIITVSSFTQANGKNPMPKKKSLNLELTGFLL